MESRFSFRRLLYCGLTFVFLPLDDRDEVYDTVACEVCHRHNGCFQVSLDYGILPFLQEVAILWFNLCVTSTLITYRG